MVWNSYFIEMYMFNQHLCRLETLTAAVLGKNTGIQGVRFSPEETRLYLSTRDRLLREIGRNVRLGKLLKERLMEPLVPSLK